MTTTPTLPTAPAAKITREQIRELLGIVTPTPDPKLTFHQKESAISNARYNGRDAILKGLAAAHPDAGYVASTYAGAGGLSQVRAEHFEEAKQHAQKAAEDYDAARAAAAARELAEKAAQTPAGKFARIRDAIKAGRRQTDRGELATPETYAQAKAAAEAEAEANTLRAEGAKEQRAAAKRLEQSKASAAKHIRENPPRLDIEALEQAVRDAHDAIDRIRAVRDQWVPEFDSIVATLESAGWERSTSPNGATSWGTGWVQIDGKDYSRTACRVYLAKIRDYIHEIRV